jgi:hypothetical protein
LRARRARARGQRGRRHRHDTSAPGASDAAHVLAAREAFKHKTTAYAPQTRVTSLDKWKPWLALGVALLLFAFWVRTCFH